MLKNHKIHLLKQFPDVTEPEGFTCSQGTFSAEHRDVMIIPAVSYSGIQDSTLGLTTRYPVREISQFLSVSIRKYEQPNCKLLHFVV
jgi:hypothetical protein